MPIATIEIEMVSVLVRRGDSDKVWLTTKLPSPIWPYDNVLTLAFDAAAGSGLDYVRTHLGVEPILIKGSE